MLKITCPTGKIKEYPEGTLLLTVAEEFQPKFKEVIVEAVVDGKGTDLQEQLTHDCCVDFIERNTAEGTRVYRRSLLYAFIVAMHTARPEVELEVKNSFGSALFCDVKNDIALSKYDLEDVTKCMEKMVAAKEPIIYKVTTKEEAAKYLKPQLMPDSAPLLDVLAPNTKVKYYGLKNEWVYFFGPMVPNLGYVDKFSLENYHKGVIINCPNQHDYSKAEPFKDSPKLAAVYEGAEAWGHTIGCPTVATLNRYIAEGNSRGIIQVCEARHEKHIAEIADGIAAEGHKIKLILIAGPSSSGKTTFAQRLAVQMRVNGLNPMPISLDNYFKERKDSPKLPDGSYDFECLEALDLDLFNDHLKHILAGETVKIPRYNFQLGTREFRGQEITLGDNGVLVVEGIHGLNEKLTSVVPRWQKAKIYISALTPLSFDDYNRIPTSDMRLLRRIVRDSQFRSHDAEKTLQGWGKVRAGEEKYIFPFSEDADVMFNTTLVYEFAVFKKYADPLLAAIKPDSPSYIEAQRLIDMLNLVLPIDEKAVPNNSIMREFIGHSIFGDLL